MSILSIRMRMRIALMMQRHTVELLKWIRNFTTRSRQATIQWHTLHLARRHLPAFVLAIRQPRRSRTRVTEVYGLRLLDVAEINRVDATALVGDDGRFAVAEQCPGSAAEEGMCLDV